MSRIQCAADVASYLNHDKIECLECGKRFSFLPNHIKKMHGIDSDEYRDQHNLPVSTPLAGISYREKHRNKIRRMVAAGDLDYEHLADASEKARKSGRGERRDYDRHDQAERARKIERTHLPPGARRADGRDADRAREYQREYRKKRKLSKSVVLDR